MAARKEARIYPLTNWQEAVADGSTKLGYREWVEANVGKIERAPRHVDQMNHPFNTLVRKLNAAGVTFHREGEVEYPDGTVVFKDDAALIYHDGDEEYKVVKTEDGYEVWAGSQRVARRS